MPIAAERTIRRAARIAARSAFARRTSVVAIALVNKLLIWSNVGSTRSSSTVFAVGTSLFRSAESSILTARA